jgi:hypothetical protein
MPLLVLTGAADVFWATGVRVAVLTGARVGIITACRVGVAVAAEPQAERTINAKTNMAGTEYKFSLRILSYPYLVN